MELHIILRKSNKIHFLFGLKSDLPHFFAHLREERQREKSLIQFAHTLTYQREEGGVEEGEEAEFY